VSWRLGASTVVVVVVMRRCTVSFLTLDTQEGPHAGTEFRASAVL
jgi:hypothetical protein